MPYYQFCKRTTEKPIETQMMDDRWGKNVGLSLGGPSAIKKSLLSIVTISSNHRGNSM